MMRIGLGYAAKISLLNCVCFWWWIAPTTIMEGRYTGLKSSVGRQKHKNGRFSLGTRRKCTVFLQLVCRRGQCLALRNKEAEMEIRATSSTTWSNQFIDEKPRSAHRALLDSELINVLKSKLPFTYFESSRYGFTRAPRRPVTSPKSMPICPWATS